VALPQVADLPGLLVDATALPGRAIEAAFLEAALRGQALRGAAVLVRTGWDRHFGTPAYGHGHPFLTGDAARLLAAAGAAVVGIDSLNIDDTADGARPVHTALLGAGIYVVEHLTGLGGLPPAGFRFFAVPPRVKGMGTFPVRAFALLG
jgi:kynurenine formamidase